MTNSTDNQVLSPDGLLPSYGDEESVEDVLAKRQKTGGRQKGTPNKQKKFELMKTAQLYGLRAVATLVEAMEDEGAPWTARLSAATEILDRGFGKAKQVQEITGADGGEIQSRLIIEFVGQLPSVSAGASTERPLQPADEVQANTTVASALNSPFRNAQLGRPAFGSDTITDVVEKQARTLQVPVFKKPWE
jgi:hypothetical protein